MISGTTVTPGGGTKTKSASESPELTAVSPKRTVTVLPSSSWTTAWRTSQLFGSTETIRRAISGWGCFGVRSRTTRPSASVGWAGLRKRALEVLPHLAEPLEEAAGRPGQRLRARPPRSPA